jgi:hypothetical protein
MLYSACQLMVDNTAGRTQITESLTGCDLNPTAKAKRAVARDPGTKPAALKPKDTAAMTLNTTQLEQVIETAKAKAASHPAWLRAIEKAAEQLISNPYISETGDGLLILGTTGNIYHSNGTCGCEALKRGIACWHRAAAQLIKRYYESKTATPAVSIPEMLTQVKAEIASTRPERDAQLEQDAKDLAETEREIERLARENAILVKRGGNVMKIGCWDV